MTFIREYAELLFRATVLLFNSVFIYKRLSQIIFPGLIISLHRDGLDYQTGWTFEKLQKG